MDTFTIGLDDFWDRKKRFWLTIPASREVGIYNKTVEDENEVGRKVKTAYLRAEDAVLASAVYLKDGENRVRDIFAREGLAFDGLPAELRLALTRLVFNPGKVSMKTRAQEILAGKDLLVRSGSSKQNAHTPLRGATIHAARAIHLSRTVFGKRTLGRRKSYRRSESGQYQSRLHPARVLHPFLRRVSTGNPSALPCWWRLAIIYWIGVSVYEKFYSSPPGRTGIGPCRTPNQNDVRDSAFRVKSFGDCIAKVLLRSTCRMVRHLSREYHFRRIRDGI
jgi:hypothetical protein